MYDRQKSSKENMVLVRQKAGEQTKENRGNSGEEA